MPVAAARVNILRSCDLKFASYCEDCRLSGLKPSSVIDTDVSEKPAVLNFKGISRRTATKF